MKNCISRIACSAFTALLFVSAVTAQNERITSAAGDKYVISAKPGGVNLVEGTVGIVRQAGRSGPLLKGDKLQIGDRVSTGADGKAEILLNPGSYLRLGQNAAFEFRSTSLDDLQIKLDSGSAIFEVFATEDFKVTVNLPATKFSLVESGIYRIDVATDGNGKVAVWKGRAQIGNGEYAVVRSGREGSLAGSQVAIAKFNRDERDSLTLWSKSRAKELAKISGNLSRDTMRTALMSSYIGRGWNMYSSFGLWVYDPFRRNHCFLPFGYGWNSPYGYGFGHSIWYYNLPPAVTQPPVSTWVRVPGPKTVVPPFAAVQGTSGSTGRDFGAIKSGRENSGGFGGGDPVRSSGPVYSAPVPATRANSPAKTRP